MTLFADILLAILWLSSPSDGARVPLLREAQRNYLVQPRERRFEVLADARERRLLVEAGATQAPLKLSWNGDTNAVFRLEIAREGGERFEFAVSNRTDAYVTNLECGGRYLWSVTEVGGSGETAAATFETEAQPPRLLRAGGVANFRDLGGWRCKDGKCVRQGRILRSAGLRDSARRKGGSLFGGTYEPGENRVTAAGIATLRGEFSIRTDVELRNRQEAATMHGSVLGADVRWVHVPFAAYDFIDNPVRGREPFVEVFRVLLEEKSYPVLLHCSGGRDRTGTLAFLLNGLLGVSDDDLCRDWEATAFSEDSVAFGPDRLGRLLDYLKGMGGQTMAEQCERYAISCGITAEEIETFRRLMLESDD